MNKLSFDLMNWPLRHVNRILFAALAFMLVLCATSFALAQDEGDEMKPPKIVVLGDSLVAAYQLAQDEGYPAQLQKALDERGVAAEIISAGVSGDTTSGGLARLDWSVPEGVDGVILELGGNDALRGLPPALSGKNLDMMVERLKARGIKVLLFGMLAPPNLGVDYEKEFNGIYQTIAQKYDVPLYPFFLDGVMTNADLMLQDGIHPNSDGVKVMVERTVALVETMVEGLRPTP